AQMAQIMPLDDTPGQRLDIGIGERAPDAAAGEPVGEAAPEGERTAVLVEPVLDVGGEQAGPLDEARSAGLVAAAEPGIEQPGGVHGGGHVVVGAAGDAVAIPARAPR